MRISHKSYFLFALPSTVLNNNQLWKKCLALSEEKGD